jgi:hypothetical protein
LTHQSDKDFRLLRHPPKNLTVANLQLLVTAAQFADETDLPTPVFYSFVRSGLPSSLESLRQQDPWALHNTIKKSLDDNLIPRSLQAELPNLLDQLKAFVDVDPDETPTGRVERQRQKLQDISTTVQLSAEKTQRLLDKDLTLDTINDIALKSLVDDGALDEQEAKVWG